jgi:hypothetical protein
VSFFGVEVEGFGGGLWVLFGMEGVGLGNFR